MFKLLTRILCVAAFATAAWAIDPEPPRYDLNLSGSAYVPHDSPSDTFGVVTARAGYFLNARNEVGLDSTLFAYSRVQDVYMAGFYRFYFQPKAGRWTPFAGAGAGSNIVHYGYWGTNRTLIAKGEAGVRYLVTPRVAVDLAYNLMYRRNADVGFTGNYTSVVTFGVAWRF
jgi:hypothetical protein